MTAFKETCATSCGGCAPEDSVVPFAHWNRAGLDVVSYRVGTFTSFRAAMLLALASQTPLRNWTARAPLTVLNAAGEQDVPRLFARERGDYGLALIEMWAYLADILAFYQERTLNEAFLGTAAHRSSIARLGALVDYQIAAGVAASVDVAFAAETGKTVSIPERLRIQSVPGQNEKTQKYETIETVDAHAPWNERRVYDFKTDSASLQGETEFTLEPEDDADGVAEGTRLLVVADGAVEQKRVTAVRVDDWRREVKFWPAVASGGAAKVYRWTRKIKLFGHSATGSYTVVDMVTNPASPASRTWSVTMDAGVPKDGPIILDSVYDDIEAGTEVAVVWPDGAVVRTVKSVEQTHATLGLVQGAATSLGLNADLSADIDDGRTAVVYLLEGKALSVWDGRYVDVISGNTVYTRFDDELATADDQQLEEGRTLLLDDEVSDPVRVQVTGLSQEAKGGVNHLKITFSPSLADLEKPRTLAIRSAKLYGNVARATHGESVDESLGDGDAAAEFQLFRPKKTPVTHVPDSSVAGGAASSLELRVDGVLWTPVDGFYGQNGDARVYVERLDADGKTVVLFGDGRTGSRLTTGTGNVTATYRVGIGRDGRVVSSQLRTLLDKPTGLKSAHNPARSFGGADAEDPDEARANVPNTVRTLGRIVSLLDYEDAARDYQGVAKAKAAWSWVGDSRKIVLTVAGTEGEALGTEGLADLRETLDRLRAGTHPISLSDHATIHVTIAARIAVDSAYVAEDVVTAAADALKARFEFEATELGQAVHLSEIYVVLQGVEGVGAVVVDGLAFKGLSDTEMKERGVVFENGSPAAVQQHLFLLPNELAAIDDPATDVDVVATLTEES
ncbi:MAG: baseplate J/gp47 family protein [Planctomycetota bacterium]